MITNRWKNEKPGFLKLAVSVFLLLLPGLATASELSDAARLSRVIDETYILAKGDVEWSYAEPNLMLEEGDLLQTNASGMAEIQFGGQLVLRVGENSRLAVIETADNRIMGMNGGRAYIRVSGDISDNGDFILTFPSGQLTSTGKNLSRIDVFEDGRAELRVMRGEIALDPMSETSDIVRAGEFVTITPDGFMEVRSLEMATLDDFDRWNEERDIALSKYRRPDYIEKDIVGAEDLEDYGEWVYINRYKTHAWRPHVVDVWRPYYYGRWYNSAYYGWTWIPEEPWGYVTHHYGSWNYDPYYGWIWVPDYYWRPAHVRWVEYGDYIGWVPLGCRGYPVTTIYPYYATGLYLDFFDSFSFTFVFRGDFHIYHHHHHRNRLHAHNSGYQIYHDRPVRVMDHVAEPGRIKTGRVRFVNDVKKLNLKRNVYKGKLTHDRVDQKTILDFKNRPELRKKIARMEEKFKRYDERSVIVATDGLPKKTRYDKSKTLDFRKSQKKHKENLIKDNKRIEAKTRQKTLQIKNAEIRKKERVRTDLKRSEKVESVRAKTVTEKSRKERQVDKPPRRRPDSPQVPDVKKKTEEMPRERKRMNEEDLQSKKDGRTRNKADLRESREKRSATREKKRAVSGSPVKVIRHRQPVKFPQETGAKPDVPKAPQRVDRKREAEKPVPPVQTVSPDSPARVERKNLRQARNEKIERQAPAYDKKQMPENAAKNRFLRRNKTADDESKNRIREERGFPKPFVRRR